MLKQGHMIKNVHVSALDACYDVARTFRITRGQQQTCRQHLHNI